MRKWVGIGGGKHPWKIPSNTKIEYLYLGYNVHPGCYRHHKDSYRYQLVGWGKKRTAKASPSYSYPPQTKG